MKKIVLIFLIMLLSFSSSPCLAASQVIDNGIAFLYSSQATDGRWIGNTTDDFYTTTEVLNSLLYLSMTGNEYISGRNWIASQSEEDIDFLTRRVFFLNSSADVEALLSYRNQNGGWGSYPTYVISTNIDTSLALQALKAANYSDQTGIQSAINYLLSTQNPDGGWGFSKDDPNGSNAYMTAVVLQTLSAYKGTYNIQDSINRASAYLLTNQNPDGGFGSSPSTVFETALSYLVLVNEITDATVLGNAINFLTSTQSPNGSWEDDPYSTALALRALANVKPNLSISSSDIIFSNSAPTQGETITITANVHNTGIAQADTVLVQFFDCNPNAGGIQIGETTVSNISAFGSSPASITWTIPTASTKAIFVSIDPMNTIDELNETDNLASKNLTSATLPDLSITGADMTISPSAAMPGDAVTITVTVRNKGETGASNVTVDIYDGNPASGGTLIGNTTFLSIGSGGAATFQLTTNFTTGSHDIYALGDRNNSIAEGDEANNQASKTIEVGRSIDLSIISDDISFSPAYPVEGNTVTINATIHNNAEVEVNNIPIRFYLGDPLTGGAPIGPDIVIPQIDSISSVPVSISWNTSGHGGNNSIYVLVDPDDAIAEINEYNNKAYKTLKVASSNGPDLTLTSTDITFSPQSPKTKDTVTITVNVRNIGTKDANNVLVQFSVYNTAINASLIIGSQTIALVPKGTSANASILWDTAGFSGGSYNIIAEADPSNNIPELNEQNNEASIPLYLTAPQGPDIGISRSDKSGVSSNTQTRSFSGNVNITLKNAGNQDISSPFVMTAFEDRNNNMAFDPGIDNIVGQTTYSGALNAGTENTITMSVSGTVLFIDSPIYLFADSGNTIPETDESNNIECLGIFTLCRHSNVDKAVKEGASWLIDHQLNVDTQGTIKAWAGSSALYYNALAVRAYKSTGKTSGTKYANILNKLVQMQAPDGSWDEAIVITTNAILSLLYTGTTPDSLSITDAAAWIIRQQNTDGGWGGQKGSQSNALTTGLALTSLLKAGVNKNEAFIQKAAQWLKNTQNTDGYWGDYPGNASAIWDDTYPVIGLALATSVSDSKVQAAKNWYSSHLNSTEYSYLFWLRMMLEIEPNNSNITAYATALQNKQRQDGGWSLYSAQYPYSFFEYTPDILLMLGKLGFTGARIDNGITWIENHINPLWEGFSDRKAIVPTSFALDALQAANIGDSANTNAISTGRKVFTTYQNTDGSWVHIPIADTGYVYTTAYALFAVTYYKNISTAEQTAAYKASNFLIGSQLSDGGWPMVRGFAASDFSSSEEALKSLLQFGLTSSHTTVSRGLSYLNGKQRPDGGFDNTGQTTNAAIIYRLAGANYQGRLDQTIAWLKANQNSDGGWGAMLGYTSTTSSTSLALIAFSFAGESGIEVARGVSWLLAAQNQDRGWGAVMGIPMSDDYNTADAVWALSISKFSLGFNLDVNTERPAYCPGEIVKITATSDVPVQDITITGSVSLQEGTSYPLNLTAAENAFNAEFTVPSDALPGTSTVHVIGTATYGYGIATTKFFVKNCTTLKPDLSISEADLKAIAEDAHNPDSRVIYATVKNLGGVDAKDVTVKFYIGSPFTGSLIGSVTIPYIPVSGTYTVNIPITITGDTYISVAVDPDNIIAELDETNNTASMLLTRIIPDLSISSSDITVIPPVIEGQSAVITAIIHNIGNLGASNVAVSFYDGDLQNGGILIGSVTKSYINSGATAFAEVTWNTFGQSGRNYIHVIVDPQNLIAESNENNNSTLVPLDITSPSKPDLAITSSDITSSNLNPKEGEPLTLNATVHNLGKETSDIEIYLYDGDPASGGALLDQKTVSQFITFGGKTTLSFAINTLGISGSHNFYISLDPNNRIDEVNETNNAAWNTLTIGPSGLNLSVATGKTIYTANEDVQITVNISNLMDAGRTGTLEVKIIDLNANVVSAVGSQELTLSQNETRTLNYTWNSAQTLSGNYKVYSHFIEAGNITAKAETPITITPVKAVSSRVYTDRMAYTSNQPVTITFTVQSASPNYVFENLTARITISRQNTVDSMQVDTKTIPILTPSQLIELKTYWNTSTNPKGTYTVKLDVLEGAAILSTSLATFEILGSNDTGDGLIGTITASPNPVYQGRDETFTYTITNRGNEDIANLNVKILIVNPDTQEVKTAFSSQQSAIGMGETITGVQTTSTLNLTPKVYLAILQAYTPQMAEPKTLASATFEVKPSFEITRTIPDVKNVLVWLNYPWQSGQNCPDKALIEQALNEAGVSYHIVLDKKEFKTELRNPYYTDIVILGDHHPIEDHFAEELREQVYSGKGLLSSMFNRQNLDAEVFGIKFNGYLSGSDYPLELLESEIASQGSFQSYGRAIKIEAEAKVEAENIPGWIVETTNKGTTKYPGIVKRQYGAGKVLFYAFDLGLSSGNYSQFATSLKNSLNYIHKPLDTTAFHPNQLIPVEIKIKSLGGAFDLRITETYPADLKLYDPLSGNWITENPWVINMHLEPNDTKTILYHALTPDTAGTFTLQTEVGYMDNGTYNFYQNLSTDIVVAKDTITMTGDIITALKALSVTGQEKAKMDNAITYIGNIQGRTIISAQDIEMNIRDILKAIDSILSVTSANTSDIRTMMDELLEVWMSKYYFER